MRVIYSIVDNLVFHVEPPNEEKEQCLEPLWRDDFRWALLQFSTYPVLQGAPQFPLMKYEPVGTGGHLVVDPTSFSESRRTEMLVWRAKAEAMLMMFRWINLRRSQLLPQLVGQDMLYRWKVEEARIQRSNPTAVHPRLRLLNAYAEAHSMSPNDAANLVLMKDEQFYTTMADTEIERGQYLQAIRACNTLPDLVGMRQDFYNRITKVV